MGLLQACKVIEAVGARFASLHVLSKRKDDYFLYNGFIYSNSSHPLSRLPKTNVRLVVDTRMSPLSCPTSTIRSCTSKGFEEKLPSSGVNPMTRSLVMNTAP